MKAYTYLIGWTELNKYYYGVRYSKDCHPSDLFVKYFTSSKQVHKLMKQSEPDIIQIRKTFSTVEQAVKWESTVLRRLDVIHNDLWLNQNWKGRIRVFGPHTEETRRKMSLAHAGKTRSKRGPHSEETKHKMRAAAMGRKHTEETRRKMVESRTGMPHPRVMSEAGSIAVIESNKRRKGQKHGSNRPIFATG